jgi:predicted nucleotidyltransferase
MQPAEIARAYLRIVDEEAPGLVEGLYLVGSVALGEFRPHTSDVDFVAVTAAPPDDPALAALSRAHHRLRRHRRRPTFDGVYVTWHDLRRDPVSAPPGPSAHEGRFRADPGARDPVTWHTLARCGVHVRGPAVADLHVWADERVLRRWVLRNLDDYWGRLRAAGDRLASPTGVASLTPYAVVWCVPGLARIHYTLVTGAITSKEGGALHALGAFPRWHRIVEESLRIRRRSGRRSLYRTPLARRRDLIGFWDELYADAQCLGAG